MSSGRPQRNIASRSRCTAFFPHRCCCLSRGREETSFMKGFLSAFRSGAHAILAEELGHALWKKTFRERVLRKGESTPALARDIFRTPVKENLAPTPEAYEFQGSFVKWLRPGGVPESEFVGSQGNGPVYRKSGSSQGDVLITRGAATARSRRITEEWTTARRPSGLREEWTVGGRSA
ncbi:MAG: hypothetical protein MZV64_31670 [Ignavibacteriales bacterium]|nr:hypothetical protein [Ignavibacteriales bacterium]